ncbi:ankyrin repeat and SOCS box protein 3 isoform 3-T4 [Polymixia lowei]
MTCPVLSMQSLDYSSIAVDGGHKEIVELLVSKGAEVNRTHTASCWTCLHQAVYKGQSEIVRILVSVCQLEALDDHKITPLFVAAQYGQQECLEILVDAGANVNAQAADLATPLMIASQEGHEGCVEVLLDHGADPNLACSRDWPQLPIHAAAEFGHSGILKRLIAVTDRVCDRGDGMVSPLYVAVRKHNKSVELLLREGYSPDAQDCTHILGLRSPLSFALFLTPDEPYSESVRLLIAAGASLNEDDWIRALAVEKKDLLQLILQHRWIPRPDNLNQSRTVSAPDLSRTALKLQELRELVCVALSQVHSAPCWLPLLLTAGLEPSLLLQPNMLEEADSEVLNYLLGFVNWSTLPSPLKHILDQRLEEKTWTPHANFESVPCLTHLCRLQVREVLGSDVLMRTNVTTQLPVPSLLHGYLQFTDIQQPSYTHLLSPLVL